MESPQPLQPSVAAALAAGWNGNLTVFLSSETFTGDLGGLDGADAICNQLAGAAGLSGTYRAWLASSTEGPVERFSPSQHAPYALLDGTVIADNWDGLTDGIIQHNISMTEIGTTITDPEFVWTNVSGNGRVAGGNNCHDWTLSDIEPPDAAGVFGRIDSALGPGHEQDWTGRPSVQTNCDQLVHLYCFEQ